MNKPACPVHIALLALNCMSDNVVLLECLAMGACRPCMHTALLCLLMLALSCRVSLTTLVRLNVVICSSSCALWYAQGDPGMCRLSHSRSSISRQRVAGLRAGHRFYHPHQGPTRTPGCTQMTHNLACHIFIPLEVRCFTLEVRFTRSWVGHPMSIWSDV
jgi:hypothetical protein